LLENTEGFFVGRKEFGLEGNDDKTKYMFTSN